MNNFQNQNTTLYINNLPIANNLFNLGFQCCKISRNKGKLKVFFEKTPELEKAVEVLQRLNDMYVKEVQKNREKQIPEATKDGISTVSEDLTADNILNEDLSMPAGIDL